jgi:hypothetical protein
MNPELARSRSGRTAPSTSGVRVTPDASVARSATRPTVRCFQRRRGSGRRNVARPAGADAAEDQASRARRGPAARAGRRLRHSRTGRAVVGKKTFILTGARSALGTYSPSAGGTEVGSGSGALPSRPAGWRELPTETMTPSRHRPD